MREHSLAVPIEVETRDLGEVREVLALLAADGAVRVDRIMLDNMARLDAGQPGARRPCRADTLYVCVARSVHVSAMETHTRTVWPSEMQLRHRHSLLHGRFMFQSP
jgi:nicotinate-nucleotide pyrophosphorylase